MTAGTPTLPGEDCKTPPHHSWTPQEQWVWSQICCGKIADFNEGEDYGGELDPKKTEGWPDSRKLTPAFLETILLHEPYCGTISHHGIHIIGAWFEEEIDLSNATLANLLILSKSRFESCIYVIYLKSPYLISFAGSKFSSRLDMTGLQVDNNLFIDNGAEFSEVVLRGAKIGGQLAMAHSNFSGVLNMNSLQVNSSLFMNDNAEFSYVNLVGAKVGEHLDMSGSKFRGVLHMDKLQVVGSLFMRYNAEFSYVNLQSARVGDQLDMSGAKFRAELNMNSIQINNSLFMSNKAEFSDVVLQSAKVGGQLSMKGSKFSGILNMNNLQVNSSLFMNSKAEFYDVDLNSAIIGGQLEMSNSIFSGELYMSFLELSGTLFMRNITAFKKSVDILSSKIEMNLDISNSIFSSLDLTNTQIKGEFMLGSAKHLPTKWTKEAKMTLRNTEVGAFQDRDDSWENVELELTGFTYSRLGGFASGETHSMVNRDVKWIEQWLRKQNYYSPQPYEQLSKVLSETGHKKKADDISYAGKVREREEAKGLNKVGLILLEVFVGYGYRYRHALLWIVLFALLGILVIRNNEQAYTHILLNNIYDQFVYSIDMLLPVIKLNELHYDKVALTGGAYYYFCFQKFVGYFLGTIIIAGLSGITKK